MSYTVIITEEIAANVSVTTTNYPITIEYNATNIASGTTYGNSNVAGFMANFGSNAISTTGNVTAGYFVGNGSLLTGLPASYSNANVTTLLASGNVVTNIVTTADISGGSLSSDTTIAASGNIVGSNIIANGQYLTNIAAGNIVGAVAQATQAGTANVANSVAGANVTGVVAQATQAATANVALVANSVAGANVSGVVAQATQAATANVALVANSVAGANVTGVVAQATQAATANVANSVAGANVTGVVAQATQAATANVATVAYSVSAANVTGTVANAAYATASGTASTVTDAAQANITSVGTLTSLSVTGNVTAGNLISAGNLQSTQQTVVGTANVGTTGNIVISGKNIATDMAWLPDGGTAATGAAGRVVIGTGWNGNISHNATQSRLSPMDSISRTNTSTAVRQFNAESLVTMNGNATNGSFRQQAVGTQLRIGGGSAANTVALTNGAGSVFAVAAGQFNLEIGNVSPYNLGNTTISHAVINGGAIQPAIGSTVTNAFGLNCLIGAPAGTSIGNVTNYTGYSTSFAGAAGTGNIFMFYNGNATSGSARNVAVNNTARSATNYYFLMNEDDVAQNQLGSLRRYHEFNGVSATTSGSLTIDKTAGQVQQVNLGGNITSVAFSNFVSSASDSVNTDEQCDTVTIAFNQGATGGYGVTFPTGSEYKYAGNVRALQSTAANSVSLVSVSALRLSGTTTYLITISPGFVS